MAFVRYYVGDVVQMKKTHPCGSNEWKVNRIGIDFAMECCGCGHRVIIPRPKFEKAVKKIISRGPDVELGNTEKPVIYQAEGKNDD